MLFAGGLTVFAGLGCVYYGFGEIVGLLWVWLRGLLCGDFGWFGVLSLGFSFGLQVPSVAGLVSVWVLWLL